MPPAQNNNKDECADGAAASVSQEQKQEQEHNLTASSSVGASTTTCSSGCDKQQQQLLQQQCNSSCSPSKNEPEKDGAPIIAPAAADKKLGFSKSQQQEARREELKAWQEQRRKPSVSSSTTASSRNSMNRSFRSYASSSVVAATATKTNNTNRTRRTPNSYAQPTFAFANRARPRRRDTHSLGNATTTTANHSSSGSHSSKPQLAARMMTHSDDSNANNHSVAGNQEINSPRCCSACSPPKKDGQAPIRRRRRFSFIPTPPTRSAARGAAAVAAASATSGTSGGRPAGVLPKQQQQQQQQMSGSKLSRGTPPLRPTANSKQRQPFQQHRLHHHAQHNQQQQPQLIHQSRTTRAVGRLSLPARSAVETTTTTTSNNNRSNKRNKPFQRLRSHHAAHRQQRLQRHSLSHVEATNSDPTPSKVVPTVSFSNNSNSNNNNTTMEVSPLTIFSPGDSVVSTPLSSGFVPDVEDDNIVVVAVERRPVELFAVTGDDSSTIRNDDGTVANDNDDSDAAAAESAVAADDDDDDDTAVKDAASKAIVLTEEQSAATASEHNDDITEQQQQDQEQNSSSTHHPPEHLNSSDLASSELDVILSPNGAAATTAETISGAADNGVARSSSSGRDQDDGDERDSVVAVGLCRFRGDEQLRVPVSAEDDHDVLAPPSNRSAAVLQEDDQSETKSRASRSPEIAEHVKMEAMAEAFVDGSVVDSVDPAGSPDNGFEQNTERVEAASDGLCEDTDYEKDVVNAYSSVSDNEPMDEDECTKQKSLRIEEECPLLRSALADFNKENLQSPTLSVSKQNRSASFLDNAESNGLDAANFEKDVIDAYSGIQDDEPTDEEVRKIRLSIEEECPQLQSALDELGAFDWRQEMLSPALKPPARRRADVTDLPEELRHSGSANARPPPPPQRGSSPLPNSMISPFRSDNSYSREIDSAKEKALASPAGDRPDQESPFQNDSHDGPAEEAAEAFATPDDENLLSGTVQDEYSPLFDYSTQMVSPPVRSRRRRRRETVLPVTIRDESPNVDEPKSSGLEESPVFTADHSPPQPEPEDVENVESNDEAEADQSASDSHKECGREGERTVPQKYDEEKSSGGVEASSESDAESESDTSTVVQEREKITDPLKVDGKSVLTTLHEDKTDNLEAVDAADHRRLLVENRRLRDRLHSIRSDHDQRVTPFRDLFDERRKIRNENSRLIRETREMEERLNDVQKKAMAAVHIADQKTKFLQAKLLKANQENERVAALRAQLEEANSEIAALNERLEG